MTAHPQQMLKSISAFIAFNELNCFLSPISIPPLFIPEHSFLSTPQYPFRFHIQNYNPDKAPDSYNEAIIRPDKDIWIAMMQQEKDSLEHRGAFERIMPIPKDCKAISVQWTLAHKYNPDGSIKCSKEKARLVVQGFSQQEGIDFMETYAPVVKLTSMRIILAYANYHDYEIMSFDVKTAFLHAKLDYLLIVPVHVDDGLIITNSTPLYGWFINQLTPDLEIINTGPVSMYLGNRIT